MLDARALVGSHDILLITLDTLRYDVARDMLAAGRTPNLAALLPGGQWEQRHSPGSFTYAAHQAFFAGFLPTPTAPGQHPARVRDQLAKPAQFCHRSTLPELVPAFDAAAEIVSRTTSIVVLSNNARRHEMSARGQLTTGAPANSSPTSA